MAQTNEQKPQESDSVKGKLNETIDSLKSSDTVEGIIKYAKNNKIDTIGYILLAVGLILMFFLPLHGGFIIGLVLGYYFSEELFSIISWGKEFIHKEGVARSITLGVGTFAFFIAAPMIFVGAAITVALKKLFSSATK